MPRLFKLLLRFLLLPPLLLSSTTLSAETANAAYSKTGFGLGGILGATPLLSNDTFTSIVTSPSAHLRTRFTTMQVFGFYPHWPTSTPIRNSSNVESGATLQENGDIVSPDPFGTNRTIARINGSGQLVDSANGAVHATINNHQNICILANHICN